MTKRTSKLLTIVSIVVVIVVIVVAIILIWNKHSNDDAAAKAAAQTSATKQQIETNWKTFFAAATPLKDRQNLLQNGSTFTAELQAEFNSLASEASSAVVKSIDLNGTNSAQVTYTVDLNGQPVLNNETGEALLINKTWVVSDSTLCQLLSMAGNKPSVCQNY